MPFFSVIIPVYNCDQLLSRCLESVLKQTFKDYEVIVVDDGSTDGTPAIIERYLKQHKFVKCVHQSNGGPTKARKSGCNVALGNYIVCIDADDYVDEDYLEIFYTAIVDHHPDIVASGYKTVPEKKRTRPSRLERGFYDEKAMESVIFPYLLQDRKSSYFPPTLWAKAIRKDLYFDAQNRVPDDIRLGDDCCVIFYAMLHAKSLSVVDALSYNYCFNESSITKCKKPFDWKRTQRYLDYLISITPKEKRFVEQLNRKITHEIFNVAKSRFFSKDGFWTIRREIIAETKPYAGYIDASKYGFHLPSIMMKFSLKFHFFLLLKIYSFLS